MSDLTHAIYRDHQPPEILALMDTPDIAARGAKAIELDAKGFVIDTQIMIWGWDAGLVMAMRQQYGYPWVPNAFQPPLQDPFKMLGGASTDLTKPWPRSIKVSTDAADYPPFNPPTAPAPAPVDAVGFDYGNGRFAVNYAAAFNHGVPVFKTGDTVIHNGVKLYYKSGWAGTGMSLEWETEAIWNAEPKS